MKRFLTIFVTALLWCLVTTNLWAAPPSTQARYLGFSSVSTSGAKATWINGNGVGRLVVISTDNTWETITDYASENYSATDGTWTNKVQLGTSNDYVIGYTTGTTRTINLSGLTAGTTYYVRIYEYNGTHGSYQFSTATGAQNPRSFTTLAGLAAPAWAGSPVTTTQNTNTVALDWESSATATGYVINVSTDTGVNFDANRLADYTDLDVGNETAWDLYLPIAGTYYVTVYAYNNSEVSGYNTEQTITINVSMPPKFLDGDAPTLTTLTGANAGNFTVTLNFDQALYNANNGAGALETSDFAVYAPSGGSDASSKVVIQSISHNAGDQTVTLTLRFNDRVTTSDKFRIGPANASSIYSVNGLIPGANGVPMDISLHGTKGGQYSADITCPDASVLNTSLTPDVAFTTIGLAIGSDLTLDGHTLQLKDGTTYSENVDVTKELTITDEDTGVDAIISGYVGLTSKNITVDDIDIQAGGLYAIYYNGGNAAVNILINDCDLSGSASFGLITRVAAMGISSLAITGCTFDMSATSIGIDLSYCDVYATTISVQGNTFNNMTGSDIAIKAGARRSTSVTNLNIGTTTGNTFNGTGTGIYFYSGTCGDNGITNISIHDNDFSGLTGKAIDFEDVDLTNYLPVINLETGNSNNVGGNCTGVTSKYVYSHSTLALSDYLYPGIAVLALEDPASASDPGLEKGTGVEYHTVAGAIAASSDDGTETVFLGEGTYSDAIALNEAVNLVGKGAGSTSPYTRLTNTLTITGSAEDFQVSDIALNSLGTDNGKIIISTAPATGKALTINACSFDYDQGDVAIDITASTIAGDIDINSSTFAKSYNQTADGSATAIRLANNQIATGAAVTIDNNDFAFNSTGTKDIGIYVSTTNSTGASTGTLNNIGNTFASAQTEYNAVGDAIVFEDAVDISGNPTYHFGTGAINIYDGNDFSQVGYAIKVNDLGTYSGAIRSTMPTAIDVFNGTADGDSDTDNIGILGVEFYGLAWRGDLKDDSGFLYPSIQAALDAALDELPIENNHLRISRGTFNENVVCLGTDLTVTDIYGFGSEEVPSVLGSSNTFTLNADMWVLTNYGTFYSPTVILNNANATMPDAIALVKTNGTIRIPNGIEIDDDATLNKTGVTITKATVDGSIGGTYSGTLTVTADGSTISYLNFTNADNSITITPSADAYTHFDINNNTFANDNEGAIALSLTSGKKYGDERLAKINDNTFNFGTTNDRRQIGINLGRSNYQNTFSIYNNTFNMEGGTAATTAGADVAINIEVSAAAENATPGTLNIYGNTFSATDANVANSTIGVLFRNTVDDDNYDNFSAINIYNGNTFANEGYSIWSVNENSICDNLPASIDLYGTSSNTFTVNPGTNLVANHYRGFAYVADLTAESAVLTPSCTPPAAFTTGTVTPVSNNIVAGYYNSTNTALEIVVPIDNDAALEQGTVQIQVDNAGGASWSNVANSGLVTITNGDLGTNKTITVTEADLDNTGDFTEGSTMVFRAVITNYGGLSTNGGASATSIIRDETAPTVTFNSTTAGLLINIAEKAAGFDVNAQSNQNNTTLYVVNTTATPAPTYANIGTVGFASANAPTAGSAVNIAVTAGNANIVDAATYNVFGMDAAGNLSAASVGGFTTDLTAPADFNVSTVDVPGEAKNGYYNKADHDENRTVTVVVPVANDATLTGGTIQVRAKRGVGGSYENVGNAHTILIGELNTNVTVTLTRTQFEGITDLSEGDEVYFTAVITDLAGNPTTGTASANTLIFDIVPPSATTIASRTAVTAPVVANYFNDDNTAVTATIDIPNDNTLIGGNVKLQARINANAFADVAVTTNAIATVNTTTDITVQRTGTANTDLAELTGWGTGTTLDFRAVLTDAAGNETEGTTFGTTMNVDLEDPAAPTFTLNSSNCINESNVSAVSFTVTGEANATVSYTVADAGNAHTISNTVNLGGGGSANVTDLDLTSFNDGVITVSGTQTDLAGNVSASGNDTETKNTDDAGITTLTLTSNNFLNMYAKNDQTLTLAIDADEDVIVTAATIEGNNVIGTLDNAGDADASTWRVTWTVAGVTTGNTGVFSITLQDACGNTATFTQADLTGTNVTYDNTVPVVNSIVRYNPSGEYTNADNPVFRVTFSEPVEITNTNVFTFSGTCTGAPAVQSATGAAGQMGVTDLYTTWDVTIQSIANENGTLEIELDDNLANVRDKASNNPAAYTDGESYTIDNTPPAVAVTTPTYDGSRIQALAQLQGTYSDANGVTAGNVKVSVFRDDNNDGEFNGTDQYWNGTSFSSASEQKINANRTGTNFSGNWTYNINLTGYDEATAFKATVYATDVASNENSASRRFVVDPVPPKVLSLTKTDNNTLVVTFDEGMDENWVNVPPGPEGNGLATFYAVSGTVNGTPFGPINPTTATRGGGGNEDEVTLDFAGTPFQGILQCETISILVTGVKDIAGNIVDEDFDQATYTEPDVTAPYVVSIQRSTPATELTNATPVIYQVTFSEDVQGVTTSSFETTGSGSALGTISAVQADNEGTLDDVWFVTVAVGASADGETLGIQVKAADNGITDDQCAPGYNDNAFNQGANSISPNQTYVIDRTAPVISAGFLTHPLTGDYWNESDHNITWDDTKVTDGYSTNANTTLTFEYSIFGDFTDAASVTPTATDNAAGSPLTWTIDLPDNTSVNTAKVRVKATDQANNTSDWYVGTAFVLDNVAPTATIAISPYIGVNPQTIPNDYSINNATTSINLVVTFNEAMDPAHTPTITITGFNSILTAGTGAWSSGNTVYTMPYTVSNTSPISITNGSVQVSNAKDLAQNTMETATKSNVKVDQVLPTVVSLTTQKSLYNKSDDETQTTFTVVFSEDMEDDNFPTFGFYQWDNVENEWNTVDLSGVFQYIFGTSGFSNTTTFVGTYDVSDDNSTEEYDNYLSYVNGATDLAGNPAAQDYDDNTFDVDMVAPGLTTLTVTSNNPINDKYAKDGHIITAYIDANENVTVTVATAEGNDVLAGITDAEDGDGSTWNMPWTVTGNLNKTYAFGFTIQDSYGNSTAFTQAAITSGGNVTIDNTAPTVSSVVITPNNTTAGGYSINEGTTSITVVTTFDSPIHTGTTPTFAFTTALQNSLTFNNDVWSDGNTVLTRTYNVTDNNLTATNYTLDVTAAYDLAGNLLTPYQLTDIKVDQVPPTITLRNAYQSTTFNTNTNDHYAKAGETGWFEFTCDEPLTSTLGGLVSCHIATFGGQGGTNSSKQDVEGTMVYYIWKDNLQTIPEGNIQIQIRTSDDAGNCSNTLSGDSDLIFDKTAPVITITAPTSDDYVNGTQAFTWNLVETNASATTQAKIADGTLTNATSGDLISTLNGWNDAANNSAHTITVQHTDLAGNVGTSTVNVNKDVTPPTLTITRGNVTLGDNTAKVTTDNSVTFNLDFSEPLLNFGLADITINAGGTVTTDVIGDCTLNGPDGNNDYTLTITNVAGDGSLGITVNKTNFTDRADNQMENDVTSETFTIDNTAPTVYNVENNCDNSPIDGYTYNQAAKITFSEGVYTNSNASGALDADDLSITASGGNATLQSWNVINGSHTAGGTIINVTTNWNGTVLGSEKLRAEPNGPSSIYDQAGNSMDIAGSDVGGPSAPKNWDYAKAQIVILTQPTNGSTCETGSVQYTTSAMGGLSVAYQWQYYNGSEWVNLTNETINGATFSNVTTSQMTVTNPNSTNWNGKQFRCNVTNDCGSLATNTVTLTVNPNTYIATQPDDTEACFGAVDNNLTVTAGGHPPVTYQWQYRTSSDPETWANVVDDTPANADYSNQTTATLNIQGNIAAGTYYYRVIVGSACGDDVTSAVRTLTVNPLPNAGLTVGGTGTICEGSSTNITVALSEPGVSYQLRNNVGNVNVGDPVAGTGGTINLPTGNLTSTTTFNVLATNATTFCSVQLTETETVTVEPTPVNPTLASKTPNQATVCQGSEVSATFNAGSGGSGTDTYQYSLDNGGSWNEYIPGNNLTAGTQTIIIQGRRNASVCNPLWSTLATWNVELTPDAPTLTKVPNTASVCYGDVVYATWPTLGTGGNGNISVQYSTNNGGSWLPYSYTGSGPYTGANISTTGLTTLQIRFTRMSTNCAADVETVSWTVNPLPTASISGTTPACESTLLTATTNATSPSYQWKLNGGNVGTNSPNYTATASGNYTVVVTDGVTGCMNESSAYAVVIDAMPTQYNVTGGPYCAGSNIGINLSGSQNGYTYNLKRDGSTIDNQTGNGGALTFNVNAAQAGTYTIEAVNGTCTIAMNGSVTVNSAPTAFAGADAYTCGTTGYTVNDATATNYASLLWTHNGVGSLSGASTLTPTYTPAAGDIGNTVTLTLTVNALNGCVNTSDQMLLEVRALPNASINASGPTTFCAGGSVTLTAAENGATYQWRESGNAIIGETSQSLFVNTSGNYTVTVTKNGCTATTSEATVVTVNPNPSITTNAINQERCGTGNVTFTAATTSPNSVIDWSATNDFASYTSGDNRTVSVTAGNTDTYYYRARNTVTGCVSGTQSVTGTAYVVPTPTISGDNTVGLNTNLTLTTQSGKSGYTWSVDGGTITSGVNTYQINVQWSSAGTKNVTVTYSENGCPGTSAEFEVTVSESQPPVITGNPSNTTKCSNEANATFSVTSVSGVPAPTLEWQVNDGNGWVAATGADYSGGSTTELTVYNLSGKNGYQYKLVATNIHGSDESDAATLTVTAAQTPSVSITSDDADNTFCSGTNVTFTATPSNTGGGTVSYQWKLNGGNVGANQNTYSNNSLANNDQVQCVITITGGCVTSTTANSNTITNTVLVNTSISQHPQNATVNEGDNHTFTVTASGDNLTYTWYKVGTPDVQVGTGSSLQLTNIQASDAGNYYVIVSGTCGNVQSNNATLTVQQPAVKLAIDNIGTQTHNVQFSITVRSLNSSNVETSVTQNTSFEITVETGTGTIGTVTGTINNGSSSATVNVTYNKSDGETGVSLKATRTSGMNLTAGISNTFTVKAAEPSQITSFARTSNFGSDYIELQWTKTGTGSLVIARQSSATNLTDTPTDGNTYTSNPNFNNAPALGNAKVVFNSTTGNSVWISGLQPGTQYAFAVFAYNGEGSATNYNTTLVTNSNRRQYTTSEKGSVIDYEFTFGEHFILTGITPNPATSDVNFTVVTKEAMDANIEIVNELGVVVHSFSKSLTVGEHPFSLKLGTEKGGLPSGTYLLRVTAGGESLIQKFIYMP